jgi:hypothetical protein
MSLFAAIKRFFGFSSTPAMSPNDRLLPCEDCGKDFVFDEGEQKFFKLKGFSDPKRCPRCRKQVKFRLRRKKRGGGGGNNEQRFQGNHGHHGHQGRRHGRSVIDGRSPYADER